MVKNETIKDDRNARQQSSSSDADDGPDERRISRGVSVTIPLKGMITVLCMAVNVQNI